MAHILLSKLFIALDTLDFNNHIDYIHLLNAFALSYATIVFDFLVSYNHIVLFKISLQ